MAEKMHVRVKLKLSAKSFFAIGTCEVSRILTHNMWSAVCLQEMELSYETRTYHPSGLVTISTRVWDGVQYHWNRQVRMATPQDMEDAAITAEYFARPFGVATLEEMEEPLVVPEGPSEGVTVPLMPEGPGASMDEDDVLEEEVLRDEDDVLEEALLKDEDDVMEEDLTSVAGETEQPSVSGGSSTSSGRSAAEARQLRTFRRRQRRKRKRAHTRRERARQVETETEAEAPKHQKMSSAQELDLELELDASDVSDGEFSVPAVPRRVIFKPEPEDSSSWDGRATITSDDPVPAAPRLAASSMASPLGAGSTDRPLDDSVSAVPRLTTSPMASQLGAGNTDRPYCPLCRFRVADYRLRRHIESFHLPWWIAPDRACWRCRVMEPSVSLLKLRHGSSCAPAAMTEADAGMWVRLCNGLLSLIREDLGCQTNVDLLRLVTDRQLYPSDTSPFNLSLAQRLFFRLWEYRNRQAPLTPLEDFNVQPPSTVACLLNPKVLACLLTQVSTETVQQVGEFATPAEALPRSSRAPWVIDAHIHLDALGVGFRSRLGEVIDSNVRAQFLIANFVFPTKWEMWDSLKADAAVYATFGIHPSLCCNQLALTHHRIELRERLLSPRCVALGEVGLDYRSDMTNGQKQSQRDTLAALLRLRPNQMPVVVHCRGVGALDDCLDVLARRVRPNTVPVQIHCFLGSRGDVDRWLSAFPNCLFSFGHRSMGLTGSAGEDHQKAARSLSLDQILLESDAPYLSGHRPYSRPSSPMADIFETGQWLAHLKGLCPSIVLEAARVNAVRAFALPSY